MNSSNYFDIIEAKNNWFLVHNKVTSRYLVAFNFDIRSKTYEEFKYEFKKLDVATEFFNKIVN